MIDRKHKLSVKRQAALLGISRGSVYYLPREVPETGLALMRRIDQLHLDYPFAGSRMLRDLLAGEGLHVGRLHVSTLMRRMGIKALYRKPNTSKPEPGHKIYPYLLRKLAVTRPNQVWAIDITTCPWREALCTSSPSSTGSVAGCLPGGCRSQWMLASAPRPSRKRWLDTANPKSSTAIRAVHVDRLH